MDRAVLHKAHHFTAASYGFAVGAMAGLGVVYFELQVKVETSSRRKDAAAAAARFLYAAATAMVR